MAPTSKPQLPEAFLRELLSKPMMSGFQSAIFRENFHNIRVVVVKNEQGADDIEIHPPPGHGARPCSMIHLAAYLGDLPLLYEALRLGTNVNVLDEQNQTALVVALKEMEESQKGLSIGNPFGSSAYEAELDVVRKLLQRSQVICRVLIEQHVHVKPSPRNPVDPIDLACAIKDWELIELLLTHGARSSPVPRALSPADAKRFRDIASSVSGKPRPPRVCPCWSGKLLRDCHAAKAHPLPLEFLCLCGSGKVYGKCCASRNVNFEQRWNEEDQWIGPVKSFKIPTQGMSDGMRDGLVEGLTRLKELSAQGLIGNTLGEIAGITEEGAVQMVEATATSLFRQKKIDPAFYHVLMKLKQFPCPQGRTSSKNRCIAVRDAWNTAVDAYIQTAADPRPRIEVERAAKIGIGLGALHRFCEGGACAKLEGRDVEKLRVCSKCRIAVYCSAECQRADWAAHKKICNSGVQREQMLPSQTTYMDAIFAMGDSGSTLAATHLSEEDELFKAMMEANISS